MLLYEQNSFNDSRFLNTLSVRLELALRARGRGCRNDDDLVGVGKRR
jgi:hypothetical protein